MLLFVANDHRHVLGLCCHSTNAIQAAVDHRLSDLQASKRTSWGLRWLVQLANKSRPGPFNMTGGPIEEIPFSRSDAAHAN